MAGQPVATHLVEQAPRAAGPPPRAAWMTWVETVSLGNAARSTSSTR